MEHEGKKVKLERRGEFVTATLVKSNFGDYYNAKWVDSDGQHYIGIVEEDELEQLEE